MSRLLSPAARIAACAALALSLDQGSATAQPRPAETAPAAVVVFDGSNSMNGRIPGDQAVKHVLVREALRRAMPKLPGGTRLGLAAFGHRRASDCNDAAVIVPPTPDSQRIFSELERFKPRGFSPVALALREAAAPLAASTGSAGILLVLDDLASCRTEDPCVTAADLVARNPRLTISVLGLGLNPAAVERMTCVTTASKGRFVNVMDAREIDGAMETVLTATVSAASPPAVPARPAPERPRPPSGVSAAPPPLARGLNLSARLSSNGPVLAKPVRWRVVRDDAPDAADPIELEHPSASVEVPAGRYRVEATIGHIQRQTIVDLADGAAMQVSIVLDAALVDVGVRLAKAGNVAADAVVTAVAVSSAGSGTPAAILLPHGETSLVLPAGSWRIAAELGSARVERTLQVEAGATPDADLTLEAGRLALSAEPPGGPGLMYTLLEDDPDSPDGRREVARSALPQPVFVVPAGAYTIVARRGAAESRERIVVRAGEEVQRLIALGKGRLRVAQRLPSAPDRMVPVLTRVYRLDGADREIARSTEPEPVFDLAPGRYRIESRIGSQNAVARRDVDVRGEGEQRVQLEHASGVVQLRMAGTASSLQFGEVFWTILDQAGQPLWRTGQPEPMVVLAAGRYTARVEARGSEGERAFEVRSGDTSRIEVGG